MECRVPSTGKRLGNKAQIKNSKGKKGRARCNQQTWNKTVSDNEQEVTDGELKAIAGGLDPLSVGMLLGGGLLLPVIFWNRVSESQHNRESKANGQLAKHRTRSGNIFFLVPLPVL
jgi:hypothetical protein